jgi:hypothetical protein
LSTVAASFQLARAIGKLKTCRHQWQGPLKVTTRIVFFPFDLFGSGGAAAGVELLADAIEEMLDDNRRERLPIRPALTKNTSALTLSPSTSCPTIKTGSSKPGK